MALGPNKENLAALGRDFAQKVERIAQHRDRLVEVEDVYPVALAEDVRAHLGIPAVRLVPEVSARLEERAHAERGE